jgi:predicted ATP-grasp superfamily ATP-dependent carboligase
VKLFVCEFVTGGGLYREALPPSLAREGLLMRDALLRDLAELPGIELSLTCDPRVPLPLTGTILVMQDTDDVWQLWEVGMRQADAVWFIAPESGGQLLRLTMLAERLGKIVIGSSAAAVAWTSSKYLTCRHLLAAEIPAVPTYKLDEWPQVAGRWVIKPDDGAGCEDTVLFDDVQAAQEWLRGRVATHVIQPLLQGRAASLCVLCKQGSAWLLSCNLQKVMIENGRFIYGGSSLNGAAGRWMQCATLAARIAQAVPGLTGYVGIDVLIDAENIIVLEINPRLTTSYIGLHAALDCNPARLVLDLIYNEHFQLPREIRRHIVDVTLEDAA